MSDTSPHNKIDYTWEREWRIQTDELALDPNVTTVVVPTRRWEEWFKAEYASRAQRFAAVSGGMLPRSVGTMPWHFIVLRDLGVPIQAESPPSERADA